MCKDPSEGSRCHIHDFRTFLEENFILNKGDFKTFCGLGVGGNIVWGIVASVLVFTIIVLCVFLVLMVKKVEALKRVIPLIMSGERSDITLENVMLEE